MGAAFLSPEDIMLPPSPPEFADSMTNLDTQIQIRDARPSTPRRVSEPPLDLTSTTLFSTLPLRPRNRSPFSRSHLRSLSSASSLSAPPMQRAHSSPSLDSTGRFVYPTRPVSPLSPAGGSGVRRRSPLRSAMDEPYFNGLDISETISEHAELDTTPKASISTSISDLDIPPSSPIPSIHHTFPRSRRRPSSPLYQTTQPSSIIGPLQQSPFRTKSPTPKSGSSSPIINPAKFNEAYPTSYSNTYPYNTYTYTSSASSMPSTPTSLRSRSPSISSLETIPDSPDAEEAAAALEAERIMQLREAAAEEEGEAGGDGSNSDLRRRSTLDVPGARAGLGLGGGLGYGGRGDKRKRWSVCGAERRGDLDLETIWED